MTMEKTDKKHSRAFALDLYIKYTYLSTQSFILNFSYTNPLSFHFQEPVHREITSDYIGYRYWFNYGRGSRRVPVKSNQSWLSLMGRGRRELWRIPATELLTSSFFPREICIKLRRQVSGTALIAYFGGSLLVVSCFAVLPDLSQAKWYRSAHNPAVASSRGQIAIKPKDAIHDAFWLHRGYIRELEKRMVAILKFANFPTVVHFKKLLAVRCLSSSSSSSFL